MGVYFQELKKNIFKRKILIILAFIIVFKAIYGMYIKEESRYINLYVEDNKDDYFAYLDNIEGKMNKEKEDYINNVLDEYYDADEKIGIAGEQNYNGEISDKEYRELCNELSEITSKNKSIELLTSQVNYVNKIKIEDGLFIKMDGKISSLDLD